MKKKERGKGYSRLVFEFLKNICENRKLKSIYLTVNKYNYNTIAVYEKFGFINTGTIVKDIGNNFIMDDFIFEYAMQLLQPT
ncbi:MAG: GNAT family N-acetyltransferase [Candidatus Gastranaerophilales bacterium]|nr:GNAT family N-acetyltransferase [Candidatus Gastranaerophilales bacterium]